MTHDSSAKGAAEPAVQARLAPPIVLNHTTPVPLWYQIALQLAHAIENQQLACGHRLPGPTQLAARWGVSQATAKHAVQELVGRGLLVQPRRGELIVTT